MALWFFQRTAPGSIRRIPLPSMQRFLAGEDTLQHDGDHYVRCIGMAVELRNKKPSAIYTSMCKQFVSDNARDLVLTLQQNVMGAYGYAEGFLMERLLRDILIFPIAGGSTAMTVAFSS